MRKSIFFLGAIAVVLIGTACMGDDGASDARRPAAMEERENSFGLVRLSLGQTETTWRSFSWQTNVDVVEHKSTDAKGNPIVNLVPGMLRPGTIVLERGLVKDSAALAALFTNGQTAFPAATVTLVATDNSPIGTYDLSQGVVADLKHRSEDASVLETLTLRFGSATLQF